MSGCTDKKFERMLYAYELGLLSDEDRRAVELHHLECDHCFAIAKRFVETAELLRNDSDIREAIGQISEDELTINGAFDGSESEKIVQRKIWKGYIPISVAAAVIFFLLIFKAWHLDFSPFDEAIASENRLAVMYFKNLSDDADSKRMGEIITNLIITDLAESEYVRVVSSQRLYDILRILGREDVKTLSQEVAAEVAKKASARWMLLGNIIEDGAKIAVVSQLIDIASGDLVASQRISGKDGEDIFAVIDRLTVEIMKDLSLPVEALNERDRQLAEMTTRSTEAYRFYIEGIDYYNKYYYTEAAERFKKAVKLDTTFAMAYYYLALTDDPEYIHKALKYNEKAGPIDRYFIYVHNAILSNNRPAAYKLLHEVAEKYPDEKYSYFLLGRLKRYNDQYDSSIYYFEKAIELDPLYKNAYDELAQIYDRNEYMDKAIWAINKYIDLAPAEANPYETRADMYAYNGILDKAIESYKKAVEIKPDFYSSWQKLAYMYIFSRDYIRAEECLEKLILSKVPLEVITGCYCRSLIFSHQGKFKAALEILDECALKNMKNPQPGVAGEILAMQALTHEAMKNPERALRDIRSSMDAYHRELPDFRLPFLETHIRLLALNRQFEEAEQIAADLKQELTIDDIGLHQYYFGMASIAYYKGDYSEALDYLNRVVSLDGKCKCVHVHYLMGMAYMKTGHIADAVSEFENELNVYNVPRLIWGSWNVLMHYQLGVAYEESNWNDRAVEQYRIFLDIWKNADPGIDEIADARERLKKLESMP